MRKQFLLGSILLLAFPLTLHALVPTPLLAYVFILPIILLGVFDMFQTKHAVLRNFPVIGHFRYLLESIRPEINQYFVESELDGRPFGREVRSLVYQRAKHTTDTRPFGTVHDLYAEGAEWISHSISPVPTQEAPRITIGAKRCSKPYEASLLNVSAMSFGSLSKNAIMALNGGAKLGGFAHNTGEGGLSPYHRKPGGDLIWQIGTGYFGCRNDDGTFDAELFRDHARFESVKMVEIKLSQGAKPGHGGILPAQKLTPEIAQIRHVPLGRDVLSPPAHSAFSTPTELVEFAEKLRELSGGKPVGIKLCIGHRIELMAVVKAMVETGLGPDYIAVDGAEGGTGAAPLEFSDFVGSPLIEGLSFLDSALAGAGIRPHVKIVASGKITSGFDMAKRLAIGADLCASARAMMFALGCIQALRCNTNKCPVGVATQNPDLVVGLDVSSKTERVRNFHRSTVHSLMELLGAAGLSHPDELRPHHIWRRIDYSTVRHYGEIFGRVPEGSLLDGTGPKGYVDMYRSARIDSFRV